MEQLERFSQLGQEQLVCKLKKSLYGLKQSLRQWYKRFDSYMIVIGYRRSTSIMEVNKLKVVVSKEFDMKDLGTAKKILGMENRRDRDAKRLWVSQAGYVKKVLERFSMENVKPVSTPLATHFHLSTNVQRQLKKLKTCLRSHILVRGGVPCTLWYVLG